MADGQTDIPVCGSTFVADSEYFGFLIERYVRVIVLIKRGMGLYSCTSQWSTENL
jgi:hypothetical protein